MKKGFTLAEVLVTLGIIGVVAAVTLPTLIYNYKKKVYVTQLKVAYSILSQGFEKIAQMNDGDISNTSLGVSMPFSTISGNKYQSNTYNDSWNYTFQRDYVKNVWQVIYTRCHSVSDTDCPNLPLVSYHTEALTKNKGNDVNCNRSFCGNYNLGVVLKNGMIMTIDAKQRKCDKTPYASKSAIKAICADVRVDINGEKGPNQWGYDTFEFVLDNSGKLWAKYGREYAKAMVPNGLTNKEYYWGAYTSNDGACCNSQAKFGSCKYSLGDGCAARIMENNWNIDY